MSSNENIRPQPSGETREADLRARFSALAISLDRSAATARADASKKDATPGGASAITGYLFSAVSSEMAAEKIRAILSDTLTFSPAPVASGGQHSSGEALDAVDPLRRSIAELKRHIEAVQVAKREGGSGSTITDCINALPVIVRSLEASEFEIEAAFEAYEDTAPPAPVAETAGEAVAWRWRQRKRDTQAGHEIVHSGSKPSTWINAEDVFDLTPLYASPVPAQDDDKLRAWNDFAAHINWELSFCYLDDEEGAPGCWAVHEVNGGRSDREWTVIGRGETPLDAALAALKSTAAQEGGES